MSKEHDDNELNNVENSTSKSEESAHTKKKYSTPWNSKFSDNENLKKRQYSRSSRNQPIKEASKLSQILLLLISLIVLIPFILFAVIESQKNSQEITSRTTNEITMSRNEKFSEEAEKEKKKKESEKNEESTEKSTEKTTEKEGVRSGELESTTNQVDTSTDPQPITEQTQAPVEQTEAPQNSGAVHTVAPGESWYGIARQYGVDVHTLASHNGMTIDSTILPGSTISIP